MKSKYLISIICALLTFQAHAQAPHYIDLTHELSEKTLTWPTSTPFKVTETFADMTPAGYYCSVRGYESHEHTGTHMDAPNHFAKGHVGIDGITLSQLIGPAVNIDVRKAIATHPDYLIGIHDIKLWESQHGKIPAGTIVLLNTGYSKFWPNLAKYSGTEKTGEASLTDLHFPGLDPKAANWLVTDRKIKAIGIDAFSIDYGQSKKFESHQILTKANVPIFENVASMIELPADHFMIYAFPAKIKDGTGAPLRIVAQVG
jgi:kynurenine formamidase